MSYTKHDFKSGEKLYAQQLNEMDEQIFKNTEETSKLSEDIADIKENGTGTGLSDDLKYALKTFFSNMQTLLPQLAYVTEENIGNTLISNSQAVVIALDSTGSGSDKPIEPLPQSGITQNGSILSIVSGITATQSGSVLAIA